MALHPPILTGRFLYHKKRLKQYFLFAKLFRVDQTKLNLSHLHGIPQTDLYFCPLSFEKELTSHGAGDKACVSGETVSK